MLNTDEFVGIDSTCCPLIHSSSDEKLDATSSLLGGVTLEAALSTLLNILSSFPLFLLVVFVPPDIEEECLLVLEELPAPHSISYSSIEAF